ncbi:MULTISPECIES: lipopolysaccharide biosynthesis protein [unclassified Microbacterium]|uniref:lipopolysaccharide biosynthesis protein n=1 Tax=unclassified Microbacterium TaxID=2609290 RepID=UPI002469A3C2|nr:MULTISPECIES: lipopolysaccharide biosynthesis protein [unclassified Microbacterium]MDH5134404.1 lipopolysaccharide biosynthesis protein [Microbacterium sp. RD10]MDH5136769.1 lipopolysaccharide biosynthesis protein [Microbacterium sp. RD11]MDH5145669.1 lipopolysaccharide biosynthesis protein [Microbacterium sp. RD12]MDH5155184.1 lipopolysaccharide biosynthesis protein [Microbacterium sp. RD06]MDH5166700.1 lipopolysaccharide biosynthesis protein [Microbacterium sp. RD02]
MAITSGTLLGQLIVALATPVLSRMYPPEAFGAFSAILAIASAIGPAAALKFDSAILLPEAENDARGVLGLSLVSTLSVSALAGLAALFFGPMMLSDAWVQIPLAPLWIFGLVLTTGLFTSLVQAALRAKSYGLVGWRSTIQSVGITIGQLGLGLLNPSATGLLGGALFGRLLGFGALYRGLRPLLAARGGASQRALFRRYWRSPVILAPSALLNALGSQLPLVMVAAWFGTAEAGQLGMAQRLVFLPAALLGAALAQVFGAEIADRLRNRSGSSRGLYLKATLRIGMVAAPMCLAILLASPWLLPWLLGPGWQQSGLLAQAMAVSASVGLIVSPLSAVYAVHQSVASLAIDGSRIAFIVVAAAIVAATGAGVVEAVWALYAAQVLNYIVTWVYGLRIVSRGGTA